MTHRAGGSKHDRYSKGIHDTDYEYGCSTAEKEHKKG